MCGHLLGAQTDSLTVRRVSLLLTEAKSPQRLWGRGFTMLRKPSRFNNDAAFTHINKLVADMCGTPFVCTAVC